MENAASTQGRLQQELELRKSELEKISTLEEKIKMELAQLQVRAYGAMANARNATREEEGTREKRPTDGSGLVCCAGQAEQYGVGARDV